MDLVERGQGLAGVEPRLQGALSAELGGEGAPSALGLEVRLQPPCRDLVWLEEVALLLCMRDELEGDVSTVSSDGGGQVLQDVGRLLKPPTPVVGDDGLRLAVLLDGFVSAVEEPALVVSNYVCADGSSLGQSGDAQEASHTTSCSVSPHFSLNLSKSLWSSSRKS